MKTIAIILASGSGSRFGNELPKQFTKIGDKTILELSTEAFERVNGIDSIILVVTPEYVDYVKEIVDKNNYKKVIKVIAGGAERKDSSFIGVNAVEEAEANVLIHDCARPLISKRVIEDCISALSVHNAVAVGIPSTDTMIEVKNNIITNIPERANLMRIQTPQCFKLSIIKKAHELSKNDKNFTDDCGLVVRHDLCDIYVVSGERSNIKITYPEDIYFAENFIKDSLGS